LEAYCVKCKTKREIQEPQADFNAAARRLHGYVRRMRHETVPHWPHDAHEGMVAPKRKKEAPARKGKLVIVESPAKARR
jgi:DNA topoisomerase I